MGRAVTQSKGKPGTARRRRRYPGALIATGLVVLGGSGAVALSRAQASAKHLLALGSHPLPPGPAPAPPKTTTTTVPTTTTTTVPKPRVLSVRPVNGSVHIPFTDHVTVQLSMPPRPGSALPFLEPAVAGHWVTSGDTLTFTPAGNGFTPWAKEKLIIPGDLSSATKVYRFNVAGVTLRRVQQVLAELEYLPVAFRNAADQSELSSEPTKQSLVSPDIQPGTFDWRNPNAPAELSSLWSAGQNNVVTIGAVMHFESVEGLTPDGIAGPNVWDDLTEAVATRRVDPAPYDYLMVTESLPEQLVVWQDGQYVYKSLANTGVPGAATEIGTFPVYLRFEQTTMKGTDPDGVSYDVPDVPWVAYFNGGDAVHGYPRYSYGYPQSNGCVELPIPNAQVVWGMDPIGTLVTVMAQPLPVGS